MTNAKHHNAAPDGKNDASGMIVTPEGDYDGVKPEGPLRQGWTTGACAAAAAKAAYGALLTGEFPDPVEITLPKGHRPAFSLAVQAIGETSDEPSRSGPGVGAAMAGVVKDAGDDPDVTHGAIVRATVRALPQGSAIVFRAGEGVGTATLGGLPIDVGEPAINPMPRQYITQAVCDLSPTGTIPDLEITISIDNGEAIARKTMNPRLGIVGGLSVLGTTGVVVPYSCSAWIHSIHEGIEVACANGLTHVGGATGEASETALKKLRNLPDTALIDMGDFVGGMLKYMRNRQITHVSIAGGMAKMTKLAQGKLDLHSRRGYVDFRDLAELAGTLGASANVVAKIAQANTTPAAFDIAATEQIDLGNEIARLARRRALKAVEGSDIDIEIIVFDRLGNLIGEAGFNPT